MCMKKTAQEAKALMTKYVAYLRALYHIEQEAHWKTSGPEFYGNHLLFQRLYEGTQEDVDTAAEKTIGVYGELGSHDDIMIEIISKFSSEHFGGNFTQSVLAAEEAFLELSKEIYNSLGESLTLGVDDMIMSIASRHEVHVYLLKQALE